MEMEKIENKSKKRITNIFLAYYFFDYFHIHFMIIML